MAEKKLDLHTLRALCVLVERAHVSRAAEELGLTQPQASATLASLREHFQDPLLVRTARGMQPTPNAVRIAERLRAALEHVEEAFTVTRAFDPATSETAFRISATESVGFLLIPRLVQALETRAPHVHVVVETAEPGRLRELLADGEVDLVATFHPDAPDALYGTVLYEQELRVLAAADHPRIRGTVAEEAYLQERHVRFQPLRGDSSIERQVDDAFALRGRTRRIGVTVPSSLASPPVVAASTHIATVTKAVAEHAARALALQVLKPPFPLEIARVSMYWHERTHASPAHVWLRKLIRELFHGD